MQATTGNAPPVLPTTSNAWWQLLARQGIDGAGTVNSVVAGAGVTVDNTDPTAPIVSVTNAEPVGYDSLLVTVSLLALQVADNTNVTLFLGDSGNRIADSFDSLTFIDVAGATNLDSSVAGVLKATLGVGPRNTTGTSSSVEVNDNNPATFVAPPLNDLRGASVGTRILASINFGAPVPLAAIEAKASYPGGLTGAGLYYSNDYATWTQLGTDFNLTGSLASYQKTGIITAQYIAFVVPAAQYSGTVVTLYDLNGYSPTPNDLTVRSASFSAETVPTQMKALLLVKENESAAAGIDYTFECSRDGGTTMTSMALIELYSMPSGLRVIEAAITSVAGQPLGSSPLWRYQTFNNKNVELHGAYFYYV